MNKKIFILILASIIVFCAVFAPQKLIAKEVKLPEKKIVLWVEKQSCRHIMPDLTLYMIHGRVNYLSDTQNTILVVFDDRKELGFMVFYNFEDNGIYVLDLVEEEIDSTNKVVSRSLLREYKYYYLGQGKLENGDFKATFLEGTWFSFDKRSIFDVLGVNHLKIHIPGDLKPAFTTNVTRKDGKRQEVLLKRK